MIQDKIISLCIMCFSLGLVPQVMMQYRTKTCGVSKYTAYTITIPLYVLTACFSTMGLWFSAVLAALQALLWNIILVQTYMYKRP